MPFYSSNSQELEDKILSCDYEDFEGEPWDSISRNAKKFIRALITPILEGDKARLNCKQALEHPWIAEN